MGSLYDLKIFKLNRIKYEELWQDAVNWIRKTYNATQEEFTMASPFAQFLSVMLHMGRMIFYYIEDSITGLNIKTAYRPDQIKGLARLTGHNPGRAISARGAIRFIYKDTGNMDVSGKVCFIPNKIKIVSTLTGVTYTVLLSSDTAKVTMNSGNYLECNIIQGTVEYQKATGTGLKLQSYNFRQRNYTEIEEYFVNIYVNSQRWDTVDSLLDLGFDQKGVVVKTGQTGGIDIFFGNGDMGAIPAEGSQILVEYIVTDGLGGNLTKSYVNEGDNWQIDGYGYMQDGTQISLNEHFRIEAMTDIIFGSNSENTTLTQIIAPHTSRSMVLANETNYKYFFKRMNMFSTIEVIKGYASKEANTAANIQYDQAETLYNNIYDEWSRSVATTGESSAESQELYTKVQSALNALQIARQKVEDTDMPDNTVYIMLIPDITKRISNSSNYFTCDEDAFTLSSDEQYNILQMIENSGQKIITMENRFLEPKIARFSINAQVKVWESYSLQSIYTDSLTKISNYLINRTRKDIIPVSDITALLEQVNGIDSVKVWFDADIDNQMVYGVSGFYGIDEYGDVVLTRTYINQNGNTRQVRDILPLFRGGFVSPDGIEYSDTQSMEYNSAFNIKISSYTQNTNLTLNQPVN